MKILALFIFLLIIACIYTQKAAAPPTSKQSKSAKTAKVAPPPPPQIVDVPEPVNPILPDLPTKSRQQRGAKKLCTLNQTRCDQQKALYVLYCGQDPRWCNVDVQTVSLLLSLCAFHPDNRECKLRQPSDINSAPPLDVLTIIIERQICKTYRKQCDDLFTLYSYWCDINSQFCDQDIQNLEVYIQLCPKNPQFCSQQNIENIQRKILYKVMHKEFGQYCAKFPQHCFTLERVYKYHCKQSYDPLWCKEDYQVLRKYVEICEVTPEHCTYFKQAWHEYINVFS